MKQILSIFLLLVFASACSDDKSKANVTSQETAYAGYNKVYESGDMIVLRKSTAVFATGPGQVIEDSVSEKMLDVYRRRHNRVGDSWYVNFKFTNLYDYLSSFTNGGYDTAQLGVRVYFSQAQGAGRPTVLISPTYRNVAMWRNTWAQQVGISKSQQTDDIRAFNQGSICPVCDDDQDEPQQPLTDQ
jgi:hypothetical protein